MPLSRSITGNTNVVTGRQTVSRGTFGGRVVGGPWRGRPTAEARRDAFAIPALAREVFQQIARRIRGEVEADTPTVYRAAYRFACDVRQALEPLSRMGKQVRVHETV